MALPKIIVEGRQVEVKKRKLTTIGEIVRLLVRLRSASSGIYTTSSDIAKIETEQASIIGMRLTDYVKLLRSEFVVEQKLMSISAKTYNVTNKLKDIGIEIEKELRENKIVDINAYLQRLRRVLADARPLMDEYALIEKFEFAEERYKFFFESHSTAYEKIFLSMKKKFGALHQQVSQLGLAIEALQNLSSIIDRFKI